MIKILFLAANPANTDPLQLAEEVRAIDEALQKARYRDAFALETHWAVRTRDVQGLLLRHQPDIVHFSGHGTHEGAIILEDDQKELQPISPRYLRALFRAMAGKTRLVVLSACHSQLQAADLVEEVGLLIGTTAAITDDAARAFAVSFYQALVYGCDVQTACDLGREQIQMDLAPESDVLQLLHAANAEPRAVRFVQPGALTPAPDKGEPAAATTAGPGPGWPAPSWLLAGVAALLAGLIGVALFVTGGAGPWARPTPAPASVPAPAPTPSPPPVTPAPAAAALMPADGFNIAVAGFLEQTAPGFLTETVTSRALSDWLYAAASQEAARLPAPLRFTVMGPDRIEAVAGATAEERARNGQVFADRNNVTLLIYGTVQRTDTGYTVAPAYYVGEENFAYGSEIAGSDRLGQPAPFQLPITTATLFDVNSELNGRTQVLRHLIAGLANFAIDEQDAARREFQAALTMPGWGAGQGREVIHLLLGAAELAAYDPIANPAPLAAAKTEFAAAYALNPQYARALLGMGAVLLQEACLLDAAETGCGAADSGKLAEARAWYAASLQAADRQAAYFVELKAAYGLGLAELLGSEFGFAGYERAGAARQFERVIALGEGFAARTIVNYVSKAYGYLGRIAGWNQDFAGMAANYRKANTLLADMAPYAPPAAVARNWANVGNAEEHLGNTAAAHQAYCHAATTGKGHVGQAEYAAWQAHCSAGGSNE